MFLEVQVDQPQRILHFQRCYNLNHYFKWYYDQKNHFYFSSDFETLFTKHTPCEILGLNFEKKTVYLKYNFLIQWSVIITPERIQ